MLVHRRLPPAFLSDCANNVSGKYSFTMYTPIWNSRRHIGLMVSALNSGLSSPGPGCSNGCSKIYPVDSVIHPSNNWAQEYKCVPANCEGNLIKSNMISGNQKHLKCYVIRKTKTSSTANKSLWMYCHYIRWFTLHSGQSTWPTPKSLSQYLAWNDQEYWWFSVFQIWGPKM